MLSTTNALEALLGNGLIKSYQLKRSTAHNYSDGGEVKYTKIKTRGLVNVQDETYGSESWLYLSLSADRSQEDRERYHKRIYCILRDAGALKQHLQIHRNQGYTYRIAVRVKRFQGWHHWV